jgi:hypothetical protein
MEEEDDEEKPEPLPYDLLGLSEILFDIGADASVNAAGRKRVYKLSATLKETANTVINAIGDMDEIMDEAVDEDENDENELLAIDSLKSFDGSNPNEHEMQIADSHVTINENGSNEHKDENENNNKDASTTVSAVSSVCIIVLHAFTTNRLFTK